MAEEEKGKGSKGLKKLKTEGRDITSNRNGTILANNKAGKLS